LIKSSDIDALLKKILHQKDPQQEIKFTEEEIKCVCLAVREHFLAQSSLLRLIAPIKIVGDIHGQFPDLIKIFKKNGFPSE
jgi:serine/threonine-protein phosphatase PP1 catalytic subunit